MFLTYPIRKKTPFLIIFPFYFFHYFQLMIAQLYDAFYWSIFPQHFIFPNKELQVVRVFRLHYVYNRLVVLKFEYSEY